MYDILVLPGGGIKGFVLLGAVQALYDKKIIEKIHTYIGTSVGAIICYLIAIGYTPIEIVCSVYSNKWLERVQQFDLTSLVSGNGATSFTSLHEGLEKLTLNKIGKLLTLEGLYQQFGKKVYFVTYNMTTCRTEYLSCDNYPDLPCLTALRMSANVPLVFDRFRYMDCFYIDGGISDNFPIKFAESIGESKNIIGVFLNIDEKNLRDEPEDGLISYFMKLLQIPIIQSSRYKIESKDPLTKVVYVQTDDLRNMMQFNVNSKTRLDMFSIGYEQVNFFFDKENITESKKHE